MIMKKKYPGLSTGRFLVECQPLLQASNVKLKAKTKNENWKEEDVKVEEFGLTDIQVSDITTP